MRRTLLRLTALTAIVAALAGVKQTSAQSATEGAAATGQASASADAGQSAQTADGTSQAATPQAQSGAEATQAPAAQGATQPAASAQLQTQQAPALQAQGQSQQPDLSAQAQTSGQAQLAPSGANVDANLQGQANLSGQAGVNQQLDQQQQLNQQQLTQQQLNQQQLSQQQLDQRQLNLQQFNQQQIDQQLGVQFNQAANGALAISSIAPNSVFFNSGLLPGDALVSVAGRPITSQIEFTRFISAHPDRRIPVVVLRNGRQHTIFINRPANFLVPSQPLIAAPTQLAPAFLGVTFDSQVANAALLRMVTPASPAERAGLQAGDIITALNGQPIMSPNEAVQIVGSMKAGDQVVIDYARQQLTGRTQTVLAARPAPVRHTVGYAPDVIAQPLPAPVRAEVQVIDPVPRSVFVSPVPRTTFETRPLRPADPDRDGRIWDGDGRVPRRFQR